MQNSKELEQHYRKKIRGYQILAAILLIMSASVFLWSKKPNTAAPANQTKNSYPLLDPAREFTPQEDYIINLQLLRNYMNELEKQYPDSISIYYEQLNSGANISVNKNLRLFPASLSKLALAMIVSKKVEDGTWQWNTPLETKPEDLSAESGTLYETIGSQSLRVDALLKELLINSDNTAQNILNRHIKIPEDYISLQSATGLEDLYDERGFISAKEYSRMVRALYTSSYLERENSQNILKLLSEATFNDYLSQGIPDNIPFAHKYGENKMHSIFADSGIVYTPGKPYMLTVMIKGKDSTEETRQWAIGLMKDISEHAYNAGK